MNKSIFLPHRRYFLSTVALGAAAWYVPGAYAEDLTRTPKSTEGPFYPNKLPLDTDNDLLVINDGITPAIGVVSYVSGKILDAKGDPIRNALVEIWQCDANGAYLHSGSDNGGKRDANFQGFGRFMTGSTGEYLFRTIKPVKYPGRSPHIHFKVKRSGKELLTTQLYVKNDPANANDGIYKSLKDQRQRDAVTADFAPLKGAKAGELAAKFDIVIGVTAEA